MGNCTSKQADRDEHAEAVRRVSPPSSLVREKADGQTTAQVIEVVPSPRNQGTEALETRIHELETNLAARKF